MLQDVLPTAVAVAIVVLFGLFMGWRRKGSPHKKVNKTVTKQKTTGAKRTTSYLKRVK